MTETPIRIHWLSSKFKEMYEGLLYLKLKGIFAKIRLPSISGGKCTADQNILNFHPHTLSPCTNKYPTGVTHDSINNVNGCNTSQCYSICSAAIDFYSFSSTQHDRGSRKWQVRNKLFRVNKIAAIKAFIDGLSPVQLQYSSFLVNYVSLLLTISWRVHVHVRKGNTFDGMEF